MLRVNQTICLIVLCLVAGCQATSTAGNYKPANCAMVGSRCSADGSR